MDWFYWILLTLTWVYVVWVFVRVRQNSIWHFCFQLNYRIRHGKINTKHRKLFQRDFFTDGRELIVELLNSKDINDEEIKKDLVWLVDQVNQYSAKTQALERHFDRYERLVRNTTFWNFPFTRRAHRKLLLANVYLIEPNTFDDLFGREGVSVTISDDQIQYETPEPVVMKWRRYVEIARFCQTGAEVHFPRTTFERLLASCDEHNIPRTWLYAHPFSDSTKSDAVLYENLNALRTSNPVLFVERITELKSDELELECLIDDLIDHRETIAHHRFAPQPLNAVLDPENDPRLAYAQAQALEQRFLFLLHTHSDSTELEWCTQEIVSAYVKAKRLQHQAEDEIATIENRLVRAEEELSDITVRGQEAETLVANTATMQLTVPAHPFITAVRNERMRASVMLTDARRLKDARRIAHACLRLEELHRACQLARSYIDQATEICNTFLALKELSDSRASRQAEHLEHLRSAMIKLGGDPSVLPKAMAGTPQESLLAFSDRLDRLRIERNAWDDQMRQAKTTWDEAVYRELCIRDYLRALSKVAFICTRLQDQLKQMGCEITLKFVTQSLTHLSSTDDFVEARMNLLAQVDTWTNTLRDVKFPSSLEDVPSHS